MQIENRENNLSNMQLELLKLYSTDIKDSELQEVKNYLAKFFAKKAIDEADELWDRKELSNDDMDCWLNDQKA